jgi:hypothetical protein
MAFFFLPDLLFVSLYTFILHLFYIWVVTLHRLDKSLLYTVTDHDITFLIPVEQRYQYKCKLHWEQHQIWWVQCLFLLFIDNLAAVSGFSTFQDIHNRYIVGKYQIHLHLLGNRTEMLAKGSPFYLFLKLAQINFIFSDNVRILSI